MKKSLFALFALCLLYSAAAANDVWEVDFAKLDKKAKAAWGITDKDLTPDGVRTVRRKKPLSHPNPMESLLPLGIDGSCVKVTVDFTPVAFGKFSNDFRWGGAVVTIINANGTLKLNARYPGKPKLKPGVRCVQEIIMFRNRIMSWKINGKEQLTMPQGTWKPNGSPQKVQISDWEEKSETVWHRIRIEKLNLPQVRKEAVHGAFENPSWNRIKNGEICDFAATALTGMDRVFPEVNDFGFKLNNHTVKLSAAGREAENFQIAMIPLNGGLKNITFEIDDLKAKNQKVFPAKYITWNPVGYSLTKSGEHITNRPDRRWPDILLPQGKFDIARGTAGSAMFTVTVPPGFQRGIYRGWIKIKADNAAPQYIALELTVRNYTLPLRGKLQTTFSLEPGLWEAWYNPVKAREIYQIPKNAPARYNGKYTMNYPGALTAISDKDWFKYYDFMLAHRLNPVGIYNQTTDELPPRLFPPLKHLEYCYERGMNHMSVGCLERFYKTPEDKREVFLQNLGKTLDQVAEFRKTHDWKDFGWSVHVEDETEIKYKTPESQKKSDRILRMSNSFIEKGWPFIHRETANPYIPRLRGTFNLWCPTTAQYDKITPEQWKQIRKDGETVWVYVCTSPNHPYANFFIDQPGTAPRVLFWQLYQRKIAGLLYYSVSGVGRQKNFDLPLPKWPEQGIEWENFAHRRNGDGHLLYPGKDCMPLSTLRLENIRDGIEDYEALNLLEERYNAAKNKGKKIPAALDKECRNLVAVPRSISSDWVTWTRDPELISSMRKRVDSAIERLDAIK